MKKIAMVLLLCLTVVGLTATPVIAAGPVDNPGHGPPTLDRVIFVDYPKDLPAKGGSGHPPSGTTKEWYSYSGYHWNTSIAVEYRVNFPNSSFLEGIDAAFQVWEDDLQSTIDFKNVGSFTGDPSSFKTLSQRNGVNEVGWVDISQEYRNAIAVTMVWYDPLSKVIVEVDMAMNSALPWKQNTITDDPNSSSGDPDCFDVQDIATHEAGHWLMLGDLYNKPTASQTMYGYGSKGEMSKRSLESGDLAGLRAIYP